MSGPIANVTTERLTGERVAKRHFEEIHRLHSDRRVMRTLSADGEPLSEEQTRLGLRRGAAHWDEHGFGLWVFREAETGDFVGRGGVQKHAIDTGEVVALAYAVLSKKWGRGYATEMSRLSLAVAFDRLGVETVASWTLPVNAASMRVMDKLGFRYCRDFTFAGLLHRYYDIEVGAYRTRHGAPSRQRAAVGPLVDLCRAVDPQCGVMLQGSVARGEERPASDVDLTVILSDGLDVTRNEIIREANHGPMIRVHLDGPDVNVDVNWLFASELLDHVRERGAADWYMFLQGEIVHDPDGLARGCRQAIGDWFADHPAILAAWEEQQAEVEACKRDPPRELAFPTQPAFVDHLRTLLEP